MEGKTLGDIIKNEGYSSSDAFVRDAAYLVALSKLEQFRAECQFFEHKYGMALDAFINKLKGSKEREDFEQEEDLEDWRFAAQTAEWWEQKAREIRSA